MTENHSLSVTWCTDLEGHSPAPRTDTINLANARLRHIPDDEAARRILAIAYLGGLEDAGHVGIFRMEAAR